MELKKAKEAAKVAKELERPRHRQLIIVRWIRLRYVWRISWQRFVGTIVRRC